MKILLIDGNSILNRAFYAIPLLSNSEGVYTNAIYGFFNILFKFIDEEIPDYLAIAFDLRAPTFRHIAYKQYKATRKSMPQELRSQIIILKGILNKMKICIIEKEGYEADDILGSLSVKAENYGLNVSIVSGDKDLLQVATNKVKILLPKTKSGKTTVEKYFASDVFEQIGVSPKEFIDVKALMGDTSDNIPGVPGIGEKTAIKFIKEYGTLENILENYENIKPQKLSQNLNMFKQQAILSKELATILLDVPIDVEFEKMTLDNIYTNEVLDEFKRFNFKTFTNRFAGKINFDDSNTQIKFNLIKDFDKLDEFLDKILKKNKVAFIIFEYDNFIGISFSSEDDDGTFVKFENKNIELFFEKFRKFFESDVEKILFNSKFDISYLKKFDISIKNIIFDTVLAAYIINSSDITYEYDDIASNYLNLNFKNKKEIFGAGKAKQDKIDFETLFVYACQHSFVSYKTYTIMHEILKNNNQLDLYNNIEIPLCEVLSNMEINGIKINKEEMNLYKQDLEKKLEECKLAIYSLADEEFNINSSQKLGFVLFEKLGLKSIKKIKTGNSTSHDVLVKLIDTHPIIEKILEYRTYSKLKSTYVDGLQKSISKENKIHSTFNQSITTTGRISSTEPNLQNIPIKTEIGKKLRKIFIPSDEKYVFLDADYSQIELRVLAHISEDEVLIKAFKENEDIHVLTASQVFKTSISNVTKKQRSDAKAVNFGIVYGIGSFSLSQDLNITKNEADRYIEGYFEKYPNIKKYLENSVKEAKKNGFAKTIFNRRRKIDELSSSNFAKRGFGERVAMNMPIQGSAADVRPKWLIIL